MIKLSDPFNDIAMVIVIAACIILGLFAFSDSKDIYVSISNEGYVAAKLGIPANANPYESGKMAKHWLDGYIKYKIDSR